MPSWESVQEVWPLLLGIAGLWARIEVGVSKSREQGNANERDIAKLEAKVDIQTTSVALQAVQLGRIEEGLIGIGKTLDRLDRKMGED